jgi:chromosomal replication initiation ATPase DnaA
MEDVEEGVDEDTMKEDSENEEVLSKGVESKVAEQLEKEALGEEYEEAIMRREWGRFFGAVLRSLTPEDAEELKKYMKRHNLTFKRLILNLVDDAIHPKPLSVTQISQALDEAMKIQDQMKKLGFGGFNLTPEMVDKIVGEEDKSGSNLMTSVMKPVMETVGEMLKIQLQQMLGNMRTQMKRNVIKESIDESENANK